MRDIRLVLEWSQYCGVCVRRSGTMATVVQSRKGSELATVQKPDGVQSVPRPMHVLPVRLGQLLRMLCGQYKILRGSSSRRKLNLGVG